METETDGQTTEREGLSGERIAELRGLLESVSDLGTIRIEANDEGYALTHVAIRCFPSLLDAAEENVRLHERLAKAEAVVKAACKVMDFLEDVPLHYTPGNGIRELGNALAAYDALANGQTGEASGAEGEAS